MLRRALLPVALSAGLALPAAPALADDAGFLTRLLQDQLSDAGREVRISGFRGALSSRATIEELTIADDEGVWLTLRGAVLDWNRAALFRRALSVNELAAREVVMTRLPEGDDGRQPPAAEATPFSLPELPLSVRIGEIDVERVVLGAPILGAETVLQIDGTATLAGGEGAARLEARRIDGEEGTLRLDGAFSNATRVLRLDLELAEGPGGIAATALGLPGTPALRLAVDGEGPLSDYRSDIALETDGEPRLTGAVELAAQPATDDGPGPLSFRADLAGDVRPLLEPEFHDFFGADTRLAVAGLRPDDGSFELTELDLNAEELALSGTLALGPDGLPRRMALEGAVAARDGQPVLLPVGGPRTFIDRADLALDFDAAASEDWDLRFDVAGFARPDMTIAALGLEGGGRIAPGNGLPSAVTADLDFRAEGVTPSDAGLAAALGDALTGSLRLDWRQGAPVEIPELRLAGADYQLDGRARIDGQRVDATVAAALDDLARFSGLAGRQLGGAAQADVAAEAELLSGAFDATLMVTGRDLSIDQPEADSLLSGTSEIAGRIARDETGTTIEALTVAAGSLSARVDGSIRSTGADLDAVLDFADLAALGPGYGGRLFAEGRLIDEPTGAAPAEEGDPIPTRQRISFTATGTDLDPGIDELRRLLAGESRIVLEAAIEDGTTDISRFSLGATALAAELAGSIGPAGTEMGGTFDFADLGVLGPGYGGRVSAEGRFFDAGDGRQLRAEATGSDIRIGQAQADRLLAGETRLAVAAEQRGETITLDSANLSTATGLTLTATGQRSDSATDLVADLVLESLSALDPAYGGRLQADARFSEAGEERTLNLDAQGTNLALGIDELDTILRGSSRLTLEAAQIGERLRVRGARLVTPILTADADATIEGTRRRLELSARLANLAALVPGFDGPVTVSGSIADAAANRYAVDLTGSGPGGLSARVNGQVGRDLTTALAISGNANLALVNRFLTAVNVQGPARFDLRLDGPLGLDALSGTASTSDARVVLPAQGITLERIDANARLGGGAVQLDASARVQAGGRITAAGRIGLADRFPADLTVNLRNARISDRRIFDTRVSGDLRIFGPLIGGGTIAGALSLDDTEIRIPSTGLGVAGYVPPDLVHIGESAAVRETRLRARINGNGEEAEAGNPFALDISLSAPNRVFIRGRGVDAEMGGTLRIGGTTAQVVPAGEFSLLRGRLDILGRRFVLSEGLARLQGRFVPFIRLLATTTTDGITATISVEGEADALDISFSSVPELPEEEVVARILFGQGLDRLSPFQAAQLASAVATLAGRGGEGIVGQLRTGFGLDDLDVSTTAEGLAALRLGRYLTENIYTDVTFDSDGRSEVSINLDLTPSFTVRGRTDSDGRSGIGIFFERDY